MLAKVGVVSRILAMKKNNGLRQYPKLKLYVNGVYIYNPLINEVSLSVLRELVGSYAKYMYDEELMFIRGLGVVIAARAMTARYLLTDRRRFIQYKKGIKS